MASQIVHVLNVVQRGATGCQEPLSTYGDLVPTAEDAQQDPHGGYSLRTTLEGLTTPPQLVFCGLS